MTMPVVPLPFLKPFVQSSMVELHLAELLNFSGMPLKRLDFVVQVLLLKITHAEELM